MMVDVAEISTIIAAAGVLIGVVLTVVELRNLVKQRQTDLIMKLYSDFNSVEFQKLLEEVLNREAENWDDYHEKYGSAELTAVGMFFEGIGILLKRKLIDIELVDDMFTSDIKWTWEKVEDIIVEARQVRNQPEILEWFEYLHNEMRKREQRLEKSKA
jgi:hypothetical protein